MLFVQQAPNGLRTGRLKKYVISRTMPNENDVLSRQWAKMYRHRSLPDPYQCGRDKGVTLLPSVMRAEDMGRLEHGGEVGRRGGQFKLHARGVLHP